MRSVWSQLKPALGLAAALVTLAGRPASAWVALRYAGVIGP